MRQAVSAIRLEGEGNESENNLQNDLSYDGDECTRINVAVFWDFPPGSHSAVRSES